MYYQFFWFDGKVSIGVGNTEPEAFAHLGYGRGAIRALDFCRKVDSLDASTHPYYYEQGQWVNKDIEAKCRQQTVN